MRMECRETESLIQAYISDDMPAKKKSEFIKHVRTCGSCYDELETYFTIHFAIKSLDEDQHASYNFREMLKDDLNKKEKEIRDNKMKKICSIAGSSIVTVFMVVCIAMMLFWQNPQFIASILETIQSFFGL